MDLRALFLGATLCALSAAGLVAGVAACGPAKDAAAPASTAAPDEETKEPDDTGTLEIYCNPPTTVLVDGKPAGTTPISGFKVKPGSHDVTFADEQTGNRTMSVTIAPGEGKVVTSDRPITASESKKPDEKKKK
jgi:hypothetical protein